MRIFSLVILLIAFSSNSYSQYFKNAKYFIAFENYLVYVYDSVSLQSMNDSVEDYKVFRIAAYNKETLNSVSIRKYKSKLFLKLDHNQDSNYRLFYNLDFKVNDSFYMPKYDQYDYFFGRYNNIKFDSVLVKIKFKMILNYSGRMINTSGMKFGGYGATFIDSIGFNFSGLNAFHKLSSDLMYVCENDKIEFDNYPYSNKTCNVDSFNKYFTGLQGLKAERDIKMIYQQTLDKVSFEGLTELTKIEIYNSLGQKMPYNRLDGKTNEINLESIPNGIYVVSLFDVSIGFYKSFKVLVNH